MYDAELLDGEARRRAGTGGSVSGTGGRSGSGGPAGGSGDAGEAGKAGMSAAGNGGAGAAGSGEAGNGGSGGAGGAGASGAGAGGEGGAGSGGAGGAGSGGAGGGGGGSGGAGACVPSDETDCCPDDPNKREPGECGCGVANGDTDLDGIADCDDTAPHGWNRPLTLDGAQIAGPLTAFPLLVRISDAHLAGAAAADGGDIYFTAADQTSVLDFEIERYESASGTLVAWVRLPSLNAGADSILYLAYDDGKTGRSDAAGVWAGYRHVWHLGQDPSGGSGALQDATARAHGTPQGGLNAAASVSAVAGRGLSFDGIDDEVTFTNAFTGSGPSTLSGWVRPAADVGDNGSSIVSFGSGMANRARFLLSSAEEDRIKVGFYGNDEFSQTVLPLDTWKHVVWVWTGSQSTIYVDGAAVRGPENHTGANTTGTAGSIGGSTFGYDFFLTGQLDEVRVATDAKSATWLTTEFNNQRPGSTFIKNIGPAQAAPAH